MVVTGFKATRARKLAPVRATYLLRALLVPTNIEAVAAHDLHRTQGYIRPPASRFMRPRRH